MAAFFGSLGTFRGTFGSTLNGQVQSDVFYAKARNYNERARGVARRRRTFRHRCTRASSTASTATCRPSIAT